MEDIESLIRNILKKRIEPLEKKFKVKTGFFLSLVRESPADDWAFIVKLHALIEVAVAHYLEMHFGEPKLKDVFQRLAMSDKDTGKMAFLESLDLLKDYREFIKTLSGIRNAYVHDISNVSLRLEDYFEKKGKIRESLIGEFKKVFTSDKSRDSVTSAPRTAIWLLAMYLLVEIYEGVE
ncbi:MAG: hypothetical protein HY883_06175 [Deltaproteobacteria bacterium]|nr:hypothetical protein [Deltaproteobacteria bacterium]